MTAPRPLSMQWWTLIATTCGHIAHHHPDDVPAVQAWLDQLEAAIETNDLSACERISVKLPAPISAVLGTVP